MFIVAYFVPANPSPGALLVMINVLAFNKYYVIIYLYETI